MIRKLLFVLCICFGVLRPICSQTVINSYHAVLQYDDCEGSILLNNVSSLKIGDTILIIQMKGAVVDSSNNMGFGSIVEYRSAGKYEFNIIEKIQANSIAIKFGLQHMYDFENGRVQVVKVPTYSNYMVNTVHSAPPWNGSSGGVFAITVNDTLFLNADIDVSGKGFRGGVPERASSYTCNQQDFFFAIASTLGGSKGEGIATLSDFKRKGKGKQSNGGGGGNDTNSGGGGGGNGGFGGNGGRQWEGCSSSLDNGGHGGAQLVSTSEIRFFLGGGGGAAHDNDGNADDGGSGGGIVIIKTGAVVGPGLIKANGASCSNAKSQVASNGDGQSGGGAGGSVAVYSVYPSAMHILARGGAGGNIYVFQKHGPGGGGGGGLIITKNVVNLDANPVAGGQNGTNVISGNALNASPGGPGRFASNLDLGGFGSRRKNAKYSILASMTSCNQAKLIAVSTGDTVATSLRWLIDDSISYVGDSVLHTFGSVGVSIVKLIFPINANAVCFDTVAVSVNVVKLNISFTPDKSVICVNEKVLFKNIVEPNVLYSWNFGDGGSSFDSLPVYKFASAGSFTVMLTGRNSSGCVDSGKVTILVRDRLSYRTTMKAINCTTYKLIAEPLTTIKASDFYWRFSNGQILTGDSITYDFQNGGAHTFQMIATAGAGTFCDDSIVSQLLVPIVTAKFKLGKNIFCVGEKIDIQNLSINSINYNWNFGDGTGSSAFSPLHTYNQPGTFSVMLIAADSSYSCKDTFVAQVIVSVIGDTLKRKEILCKGSAISFGSMQISKAGVFTQTFSTTSGCDSVVMLSVTESSTTSDFKFYPNNNKVTFTNKSKNALYYFWDFGDSTASTEENPVHFYNSGGDFNACLLVKDSFGCNSKVCQSIKIPVRFFLELPSSFTPNSDGINDVFLARGSGVQDFRMKIYNRWGQVVFQSNNIANGWNGYYNGNMLPIETLVYVVSATFTNGQKIHRRGDVTVIR